MNGDESNVRLPLHNIAGFYANASSKFLFSIVIISASINNQWLVFANEVLF